jgi:hypothetical protein
MAPVHVSIGNPLPLQWSFQPNKALSQFETRILQCISKVGTYYQHGKHKYHRSIITRRFIKFIKESIKVCTGHVIIFNL